MSADGEVGKEDVVHIYTGILLIRNKNEVMPFAATWVDLETVMLSEVSQRKITEKAMAPAPSLLPGKSHGWRSLVGCSPWGHEELDTTERLHFHVSFSCSGEVNGSPLQCSCLENPRDGGAWWAAVYGVAESRTQLKRLSSSRER